MFVGIYSNNYIISSGSPEAAALADYLQNQGGRMYLEGGDVWYYDPLYSGGYDFGPLFGINATADGSGDCGPVAGQTGTFTVGMNFSYGGENNWMDHISPTSTGFLIFRDTDNSYDCGVANDAVTYRTVGLSFELGGLTDGTPPSTRRALVDSIMKFFGIILNPGVEELGGGDLPLRTMMGVVYPNPVVKRLTIEYQLASSADVSLCVYDAVGRLVRTVVRGAAAPGYYTALWDGRDDLGRRVPAGVYFVRFETDDYSRTQKAILIK
ncbi:MAG TPA: T9SS type A sorting domain-containing protein [candidate division WOR-3 bacterium]|uniref:T9SS type A sorting domain-containing protein n=1 Tax=candidate division WOR-3 bacterium TaxID=2052148 RepID=A0A9C9ENV0_UNCW3|nr:T9SS type A sorting domain-containing protein [candidate division WOR-3 bacterium]